MLVKSGTVDLSKVAPVDVANPGDTINYAFTVTNTGNVPLTGVTVSDPLLPALNCQAVNLQPGDEVSLSCTGHVYALTQADITAGKVDNTAIASGDDPQGNAVEDDDQVSKPLQGVPGLVLVKSITSGSPFDSVGDVINYSYKVTNIGNIALIGPITVADDKATVTCPAVSTVGNLDSELDPGESVICTASYSVSLTDLNAGKVTNIAMASAGGTNSNEDSATAAVEGNPVLSLVKSVFVTGQASCDTASNKLVYVNKNQDPVNLTWCFKVTNIGNVSLDNPQVVDTPLGINASDSLPIHSGSLPLLPGESLVLYFEESGRTTSLENVASITMDPPDGGEPVSDTDSEAVFAYVFDPPYGVKTGQVDGVNVIRWSMVWINNSPINLTGVVIDDSIRAGMTYRPGTLTCDARGSTSLVGTCNDSNYDGSRRRIQVTADFGPDLGAIDEASADNELVISFEVTIDNPYVSQSFENQATVTWDPDGPGGEEPLPGITDDDTPGGSDPTPIDFEPPAAIPTLSEWAMILLSLMLMGMVWRSRSRFGVNS